MTRTFSTEAKFSAWLRKEIAKQLGPLCLVTNITGTGFGTQGVSDLILCVRGFAVYAELKQPGKKLTPLQQRYAHKAAQAGAIVYAPLYATDIEKFIYNLKLLQETTT